MRITWIAKRKSRFIVRGWIIHCCSRLSRISGRSKLYRRRHYDLLRGCLSMKLGESYDVMP